MEEYMKRFLFTLLIVFAASACEMPDLSVGSMSLSINNSLSRTLGPDISMNAASFQIRGSGPSGRTFTLDTLLEQNLIEDLNPGDWLIDIDAFNETGHLIGSGGATITVFGGDTTIASIVVIPLSGTGSLDLSLIWETIDVANPVISANLIPSSGGTLPLAFSESAPGTALAASTLDAGYYTLIIQLLDTDTVVMGTAETVRIVTDQRTSGSFDFTDVNSLDGSIDIDIDVDLKEPIDIDLSGALASIVAGESMIVTASSPAETETVSYNWYLNGSSLGSGSTLSVGSTLNPGIYRLDIIAFNGDLTRSGSVNHTFTVTEP